MAELILTGMALLIASIPARFAMDMAGDVYIELFRPKWVEWLRQFKTHVEDPIGTMKKIDNSKIMTKLKDGIRKDLNMITEVEEITKMREK